ncbi:ABC transporter substrate-binding protein [Bacillus massiliglaciei]|uniref:ABC transporter substrate-binding protein n=1 Tax=Bacillus massiliglaciei TaxID=1816693 RepID=UPI000A925728|nr:ABC transporter substrate-binding protein [Bacillus massiliglaciei]
MKKKTLGALFGAVFLAAALAGCSGEKESAGEAKEAQASEYKKQTFDNYGREVTVSKKPEKVLTLGPNATELFIALGLGDYVIGNSLDNHSRGALPEYKEAYAKIPELTYGSATREAVTTSGADFIYGIDWEFGEEGLDIKELEDFGITTYMNKASNFEEIYKEITDIGKIFHVEKKAEAYVADQKDRIAAVQKKVKDEEPVNVLVYDSGGDGVFTAGGTNFETLLLEQAGGKNIFDDRTEKQWLTVSYEEVLKREPDVIVIHDYDAPSLEQKIKDIKQDPVLSKLDCVKEERFVPITLESVLPGDRMAYTVETLAKGFYPDSF